MTVNEYAEAILRLIELSMKEKAKHPTSFKSSHLWYLYRQAFYGFTEFIDRDSQCKVSIKALAVYTRIAPSGNLRQRTWHEQHEFDKGRKTFLFEHIYTGEMFRTAIEALPENELTVEKLVSIVRQEYCVAWILREENELLPKSNRGISLQDALGVYRDVGIELC